MARDFARAFYNSTEWKQCREEYKRQHRYLCEECLARGIYKAGDAVHHKQEITPANINDPEITLNPDNLILLCRDCHAKQHSGITKRYRVDDLGRIRAIL